MRVLSLAPLAVIITAVPIAVQASEEHCTISADIAGAAVEARAAGTPQPEVIEAVTAALPEAQGNYVAAVPPIVDWVFTLPEEQLTPEVAEAYKTACLAQ